MDTLQQNESMPIVDTIVSSLSDNFDPKYEGHLIDSTGPLKDDKYQTINHPDPFLLVCFYDEAIANGKVTLYPWQRRILKYLAEYKPSDKLPLKYALAANNGSGKDKFILAPFSVWMCLCKIKARVIITTASGTQLTSQTEPYIKDLCEKINKFHGCEIFRIRQRYIKCLLSGSEIRMFATDEKGKAEGYHPIEADSEMVIIVNEGKSVTEQIHEALRRCTGFNYWLEVSSTGEPQGYFYEAMTNPDFGFVTEYIRYNDTPHISASEYDQDKKTIGEESAFFRSKYLSQFTSIGGEIIIPLELINDLLKNPPTFEYPSWGRRVGIDLAAGGDETVICITQGNKCLKEYFFHEASTVHTANLIEQFLKDEKFEKGYGHIYADDGGIGQGVIDILVDREWNINRIKNQWPAIGNKKQYGNRGAENWYRCKRILEEKYFDIRGLSERTRKQLYTRHYKKSLTGGRIFLQSKKEAKGHGFASPDRADAFILSLTGLTVETFMDDKDRISSKTGLQVQDDRPRIKLKTNDEVLDHWDEQTFGRYNNDAYAVTKQPINKRTRILGSMRRALAAFDKHYES